ncbi:hypothetical protein ARMGADRAFT_1069370 [Armillaria gallica]|uniref:Uncharacterized protein n=1 Tax=Armillaria gallica TaxID=47427 RepID=A0A2H3CTZ7_ARMGA|nr:hypothetical protein ARMGADRAFT_1069370 [Armillaria gallica]
MTSSPNSSNSHLDTTSELFYEPPFQNAITAGTGWDKNLRRILHSKSPMRYSSYKEIASAYAEILQLFEGSNDSLLGFYYHSDLKQMLSTAEIFVQYSKWHQEAPPLKYGDLRNAVNNGWSRRNIVDFDANIRHQSNAMSSKIETEISLLRDRTGLEQRYKASHDSIIDFDNRRLLGFIARVSMILAEISTAIFVCMTILAMALPWHWKFIISKAVFALPIGAVACIGLDLSKRVQRFTLAVQTLYMHYFLFIWGWNDLKVLLTHVAQPEGLKISDLQDAQKFLYSFQNSFLENEEELQLLQMRISASPEYSTKEEQGFWHSIGEPYWKRKIA